MADQAHYGSKVKPGAEADKGQADKGENVGSVLPPKK